MPQSRPFLDNFTNTQRHSAKLILSISQAQTPVLSIEIDPDRCAVQGHWEEEAIEWEG